MPEGPEDWWVRRAVLSVLLVVGIVTAGYAVVATRPDATEGSDDTGAASEVVTDYVPTDEASEGPLRLGRVLVAGRHGAPVDEPANTAESFAAALEDGVDYVEVEVVMSRDQELLVANSNDLTATTDVADREEYADRETTKTIDGEIVTGWFSEDFDLDELVGLRAVEPRPELRPDRADQDGELDLVSFDDVVEQVAASNRETGREVGIIVRPRQAAYFREAGLPIERAVAKSLRKARLINEPERVTVESTDLSVLRRIEGNVGDNVLSAYVVEADDTDALESDALEDLPDTIDAVFVEVGAFEGLDEDGAYGMADRIHEAGYAMAVYPISYENALLGESFKNGDDPGGRGKIEQQVLGLQLIGVDLILAESPAEVIESLAAIQADAEASESATPSED